MRREAQDKWNLIIGVFVFIIAPIIMAICLVSLMVLLVLELL